MPSFLDLPVEIRSKIYQYLFRGLAIRPQRKIGWNRPAADLTTPALLFANHQFLSILFSSSQFKSDTALILAILLSTAKVLVIDHADLTSIRRLAQTNTSLSHRGKSNKLTAQANLRTIDFVDKIDDVLCQPSDAERFFTGLDGLRTIRLTSPHFQRYTIPAERMVQVTLRIPKVGDPIYTRVARTDGRRLYNQSHVRNPKWKMVDLSMLVWQHFLYSGAPYRDEWRVAKMNSLLDAAEKRQIAVIFAFRNVGFPSHDSLLSQRIHTPSGRSSSACNHGFECTYKAEMSTKDWMLHLTHRGLSETYQIKQIRSWEP